MKDNASRKSMTYAEAGVDIEAGDEAVDRIKQLARKTFNSQVLSEIGSFGGFFKPDLSGVSNPVLISSADGVGTKLKIAFMTGIHNTVGEDLVNHCIDDILVHGAKPLFFLDYIATGKLKPGVIAEIVEGFSRGCANAGMALLGGETAEMPDLYGADEYDLAGFIVGLVDQNKIINGSGISEGDICLGLASNGLHTNGYTLARKIAFEAAGLKPGDPLPGSETTIDQALLRVHRCYAPLIHPLLDKFDLKGMAHITGGGLKGNLNRIIPSGLSAELKIGTWPVPPIFEFLADAGNVEVEEMHRAFNMGVGFVIVVAPDLADGLLAALKQAGETAYQIGSIKAGNNKVELV